MAYLDAEDESIRISHSPRRSPQINAGLTSPIRSIHAMQMESIHSQGDMGLRTTDFFDESSEDEIVPTADLNNGTLDANLPHGQSTGKKKRGTASTTELFAAHEDNGRSGHDHQGYEPLIGNEAQPTHRPMVDTASSSFNGSVDELLHNGRHRSSPIETRSPRVASERTPRSSSGIERTPQHRHMSAPPAKIDSTLGAYAIAHEITLNALMRDEEALDRSLQSFALTHLQAAERLSALPPALDPRSPQRRSFNSPTTVTPKKSVHVVPPPIDTMASPRKSIPEDIVRTPYPFSPGNPRHKDFGSLNPPSAATTASASSIESILTLSIRRSNANSKLRITSVVIPASNDFTAVRSSSIGAKERHFKALDFDDEELFLQLRRSYRELSGPLRFLSARSLTRIAISGVASKAADLGYGWRSPRLLAYKGLSDTFSEEQILLHYCRPALGHSRYAFVHWAHRLASITPPHTPRSPEESKAKTTLNGKETPEGLEFIVTWSVARIMSVLAIVLVLSVAAALLWTLLGYSTPGELPATGGFRDAGDRVASGVAMGIGVLLLGVASMAGWLAMSWLLM